MAKALTITEFKQQVISRADASAKEWAVKITARWCQAVLSIIETGQLIAEAKAALPHGAFAQMIETALPFCASTARRLMIIARDERLTNRKHISVLPPHWGTLYELTKLKDEEFCARITDGTIRPDMERREVFRKPPLRCAARRDADLDSFHFSLPDGRSIGDLRMGELSRLIDSLKMTLRVLQALRMHIGEASHGSAISDLVKEAKLAEFIERARKQLS